MANPVAHSYGKDAVSVYRIAGESLFACAARVIVRGAAFEASYTEGDNSAIVATDSMKNFVHRMGLEFEGDALEDFVSLVANRLLERYEQMEGVAVSAREVPFERVQGTSFRRGYGDYAIAELELGRDGRISGRSGREALHLIKLTGSSFAGFVRDEYTTLPETQDRPLFVHMDMHWTHADLARFARCEDVRDLAVATFCEIRSASIQELVYRIGERVLEGFPEIASVEFRAENRLWDTAQPGD
ncbi:MAG TPA: urate oxidase, partial [Gaiellaceae bacterium]|nr:urate oxidase [Gaiellaceae bacterium]